MYHLMICWFIALFFIGYGLMAMFSKKPYGIYSSIKAPDSKDVVNIKAFNHSISWLFFANALVFFLEGFLINSDVKTSAILLALTFFFGAILIMVVYETVISKKYIKSGTQGLI